MTAARAVDAAHIWAGQLLGYEFRDRDLCMAALTHRSAGATHNERLEFLGDAVLNCTVAWLLYQRHPRSDEGALSRQRATLVSGETLARVAAEHGFGEHLRLGPGELKTGGFRRASILADAFEALIGAVMVDGGFEPASRAVSRLLEPHLHDLPPAEQLKDPKTRLQELLQGRSLALPAYNLISVNGEAHCQVFEVQCEVSALNLITRGQGSGRRRAEQDAAERMLELLPGDWRRHT